MSDNREGGDKGKQQMDIKDVNMTKSAQVKYQETHGESAPGDEPRDAGGVSTSQYKGVNMGMSSGHGSAEQRSQ